MDFEEYKKRLAALPTGGLTTKKIRNKKSGEVYVYTVYQWRENGKQHSRYLKDREVKKFQEMIAERERIESLYRGQVLYFSDSVRFNCEILTGSLLDDYVAPTATFKRRGLFQDIDNFINTGCQEKVLILYGLRRTGKSTLMKQVIASMDEEKRQKAAYIQIRPSDTLALLNQDFKILYDYGFRYIFIDEVTLLDEFIDGAALFSDRYAQLGMKIVLSGTDSLGFYFAQSNSLYDRCILLHTTFIPYREFEDVLGIKGIDSYIECGGVMSQPGQNNLVFENPSMSSHYVLSSIANNIQHSLIHYDYGNHFPAIESLYKKGELTSAINRVVEDMNHRFAIEVLTKDFESNDLSLSAKNLRPDNDVLDHIDRESVVSKLKKALEIKNKNEQTVEIEDIHVREVKDYLETLDFIHSIRVVDLSSNAEKESKIILTQPGLRYSQALFLVESLEKDPLFSSESVTDRKEVIRRILHEIKGRMLEDIVLLETSLANPDKEVLKAEFRDGKFDMVIFDKNSCQCELYEIKYSEKADPRQYRHLVDQKKLERTEIAYGKIVGRYVLYRGEDQVVKGVQYLNVEDYLRALGKK